MSITKAELRYFRNRIRADANSAKAALLELESRAQPLTRPLSGLPRSGKRRDMADVVNNIIELREKYTLLTAKLLREQARIERELERLVEPHQTIMRDYYVLGMTWEAVADANHFAVRHVLRLHKEALRRLER